MDIETSKENIQPLRGGRNAERLEIALNAESQVLLQKGLTEQRKLFELNITNYEGDDPLSAWYEYICWIEQSYPKSGKECTLDEILLQCITTFENDSRYRQDRRLIKLYIKYIDAQPNPQQFYQELYNQGIGTLCADLYIGWAYYYDAINNFKQTEAIYRKGFDAGAKPHEDLEQAHKLFGFSMSQRMLYNDESSVQQFQSSLEERRYALTSLKAHKKKHVGSIRTGAVVKSYTPGVVNQENVPNNFLDRKKKENVGQINVLVDDAPIESLKIQPNQSIIKCITDIARERENTHEPGPWSKAKMGKKKGALFGTSNLAEPNFSILEDTEDYAPIPCLVNTYSEGIKLPVGFKRKNDPQKPFNVPIIADEEIGTSSGIPMYDKIRLYCKPKEEYSPEELRAYMYFTRKAITNSFVEKYHQIWRNCYENGIRLPPHFVRKNKPYTEFKTKRCIEEELEVAVKFMTKYKEIYPENSTEEYSLEELRVQKWKDGKIKRYTVEKEEDDVVDMDMDETYIGPRRMSIAPPRASSISRQSFIPQPRKSMFNQKPNVSAIREEDAEDMSQVQEKSMQAPAVTTEAEIHENQKYTGTIKKINNFKRKSDARNAELMTSIKNKNTNETPPRSSFSRPADVEMPLHDDNDDKFLLPAIPISYPKPSFPVLAMEDEEPSKKTDFYNDSFSTQTFNLYVKSVSTPIAMKSRRCINPETDVENISPPSVASPPFLQHNNENVEPERELTPISSNPNKQLSTIMETTETNTISTVSTTKSSVDTHITSPDTDSDDNKSKEKEYFRNFSRISPLTKDLVDLSIKVTPPFKILEDESTLIARATPAPLMHKPHEAASMVSFRMPEERTETVGKMVINEKKGMESFKIFEDKEYTVPSNNSMMSFKIPDEKTDTVGRLLFQPKMTSMTSFNVPEERTVPLKHVESMSMVSFKIPEERTETVGRILLNPKINHINSMMSFNVPDENTETISKMQMLQISKENKEKSFKIFEDKAEISSADIVLQQKQNEMCAMMSFKLPEDILEQNTAKAGLSLKSFQIHEDNPIVDAIEKDEPFKIHIDSTETLSKVPILRNQAIPTLALISDPNLSQKENKLLVKDDHISSKMSFKHDAVPAVNPPKNAENKIPEQKMEDGFFDVFTQTPEKKTSKPVEKKREMEYSLLVPKEEVVTDTSLELPSFKDFHKSMKENNLVPAKNTSIPSFTQQIKQEKSLHIFDEPMREAVEEPQNAWSFEDFKTPLNRSSMDDINTAKFSINIRNIQNSTLLPCAIPDPIPTNKSHLNFTQSSLEQKTLTNTKENVTVEETRNYDLSISVGDDEANLLLKNGSSDTQQSEKSEKVNSVIEQIIEIEDGDSSENDLGVSIYVTTEQSPQHDSEINWAEINEDFNPENNAYQAKEVDLNSTTQCIDLHLVADVINPFDKALQEAFLERHYFVSYIEDQKMCDLVNKITPLYKGEVLRTPLNNIAVVKKIGSGSFGTIFSGKCTKSNAMFALKQERPANLWEYYINLELRARIENPDILPGFMHIEYALIGTNASIFVSQFSKYGTILDVCNKVKQHTSKNVDEYLVMILTNQLLSIIDHLHSCNIIHADIKPDNILLMSPLSFESMNPVIQLIDFGTSIDMELFPKGTSFTYVVKTDCFTCTEMMENKPWTFQTDLFGVAGSIHVMLFGKYMEVRKDLVRWTIKSTMPRYFKKEIWNTFFNTLLNIRDCKHMPNLQDLRKMFLEEIVNHEKIVNDKIVEFNNALMQS